MTKRQRAAPIQPLKTIAACIRCDQWYDCQGDGRKNMMAYVSDELVIYACTEITKAGEPNVITPFIKYLEDGKEFTPRLRGWLIELLKNDGTHGHFLEYKTHRGRRTSLDEFERDQLIYERASELEGTIITSTFRLKFSEGTGMSEYQDPYNPNIFRFGWRKHVTTGGFPDSYIDESLTLKIGEILNADQIHKIVADEFDVSMSTVRRVLRLRQSLSYPDE
jgi:hypothetical protein